MTLKSLNFSICHDGQISLLSYLGTFCLVMCSFFLQTYIIEPKLWTFIAYGVIIYILINIFIKYVLNKSDYQIAFRASFLGFVEAVSIILIMFAPNVWKQFGTYSFFMALFHYSEFFAIAWSSPLSLSVDSFILNHSIHYTVAAIASWIEFILEIILLPDFKGNYYFWICGIFLCSFGEIIRKSAIVTASSSFTHLVQYEKTELNKLVTHGVYSIARHPSYMGWFWWSIGTQVILFNPICIITYAVVSWKFFNDRIYLEEEILLNFFQTEYKSYQQRVPTGLPFIKGYIVK